MRILFIGSVFSKNNEVEIMQKSKTAVEFSANIFQKKIIEGFKRFDVDFEVLSAPGIGSYPINYKDRVFKGFAEKQNEYKYVTFNNIWGVRNYSRAKSLKKALREFINDKDQNKKIIVYSVHTPFLAAAVYAKKKDPSIKICLIVPDLPQYMNLSEKKSLLYRVGKKYDIHKFYKYNRFVDSYMLLTEQMKAILLVGDRPYIVVEGIVSDEQLSSSRYRVVERTDDCKRVVYTGKLQKSFGIEKLVDAFSLIEGDEYRLILCGTGDALDYVKEQAKEDKRILCLGQVLPEVAKEYQLKANVLVNPREGNDEYTKYSFPSKMIEYLLSMNSVVAHKLAGMKEIYKDFLFVPADDSVQSLSAAIVDACESKLKSSGFVEYAESELLSNVVAKKIISMF